MIAAIRPDIFTCLLILFSFVLSTIPVLAMSEGQQAVIFMYHRFGEARCPSTNVTVEQFEEQLDFLEKNHFAVLPVEEIVKALKQNEPLPDKAIGITVDDAYRSVYEAAYPRLKARGYPFTVFVATDTVDQGISATMNWQQMQEMQKNGVTFANHSQNHDYLVRQMAAESQESWKQRMKTDIANAQKRLQKELGYAPALFAYPYGEYNLELMNLVLELGYTGFGQHSGGVGPFSDLLPSGIRINVVSPAPVVKPGQEKESLITVAQTAKMYVKAAEGNYTGQVLRAWGGLPIPEETQGPF
jgi:biofilm PGA synthesis lipoprotein PgaB